MSWVHINERSALQHNRLYTKFQIAAFSDLISARSHITVSDLAQNLDNLLQQCFQTVRHYEKCKRYFVVKLIRRCWEGMTV